MTPFVVLEGRAAALMLPNIDTDIIIRIERLTGVSHANLGEFAFESFRYREDGSADPDFFLNKPAFQNTRILVAGCNFACGSSREGAVWSLMQAGIRCVIAESFGDIFYNNCFMNGLLPVVLPKTDVEALAVELTGGADMVVDLRQRCVITPSGRVVPFEIDPLRREAMLEGLDAISSTMRHAGAIKSWQARDRQERPWVWDTGRSLEG